MIAFFLVFFSAIYVSIPVSDFSQIWDIQGFM